MVFFTAMLVIIIIYYLQMDGLIYATIVALVAELVNIFMTHALTKSVEKKMRLHIRRLVNGYSKRLKTNRKTIQQLESIQEESVKKLYNANLKIKEYEAKLELLEKTSPPLAHKIISPEPGKESSKILDQAVPPTKQTLESHQNFSDLPSGSNRRKLPF
jgi:predicted RecB family endonuclease